MKTRKVIFIAVSVLAMLMSGVACQSEVNNEQETIEPEVIEIATIEATATEAPVVSNLPSGSGVLWRLGGEGGSHGPDGLFAELGCIDISDGGIIYLADRSAGVVTVDWNGIQKNSIWIDGMDWVRDVSVSSANNLYAADSNSNSVFAFDPNGQLLWSIGGEGKDPGQFGDYSPQRLTVGPDENVYVLDDNRSDTTGDRWIRVQVFSPEGIYIREFEISDGGDPFQDIEFGPDGYLYAPNANKGHILVFDIDGVLVNEIQNETGLLSPTSCFTMDNQGDMYIGGGWRTESAILKLSPTGEVIDQFGTAIESGDQAWDEGIFYISPKIAAIPDGSVVFVAESSNAYAYLTAFSFK